MILLPAIDLKDGRVVRLTRGNYDQVTVYPRAPLEQAKNWAAQGAEWVHMVDLDAAKSGRPVHRDLISQVSRETGLKVQVGGGIRSLEMARAYLEAGVARVVVGTQAVKDPNFLRTLGEQFPQRIALGLDTKSGKISIQGWTETTEFSVKDFLVRAPLEGISCLVFTDIARDGTLKGPNLDALRSVMSLSPLPVIASGGVSQLSDLEALKNIADEKLMGVIVGKALYEGKFTLKQALDLFKKSGKF